MPLTVKLTPGYVYTDTELDTAAKRNALGNPTIDLEGTISGVLIGDGSVTTDKLSSFPPALSNDTAGHSKMEDGYLSNNSEGHAKMEDGYLSNDPDGHAKMANGYLSADTTGWGKMADGYVTAVKMEETLREGVPQYATFVSFSAGTYSLTMVPAVTAYTNGMRVTFKVPVTNTGAVSLNVSGLGPVPVKAITGASLVTLIGGRLAAGTIVEVIYDGTTSSFLIVNDLDKFDVGENTLSVGLIVDLAHGLGRVPSIVRMAIRCKTPELGYALNDEVDVPQAAFVVGANINNVFAVCGDSTPSIFRKATPFTSQPITAGNWKLVGYVRI